MCSAHWTTTGRLAMAFRFLPGKNLSQGRGNEEAQAGDDDARVAHSWIMSDESDI